MDKKIIEIIDQQLMNGKDWEDDKKQIAKKLKALFKSEKLIDKPLK